MPDIAFWNKCNNKCIMCTNPQEFSNSTPFGQYDIISQIKKINLYLKGMKVYESNADNKTYITLTGGEPTLHPDFFKLLAYIRRKFPHTQINLLTNARRFSRKPFLKKFINIATMPFSVAINFPSVDRKIFEKITRAKSSYQQTKKAIENLFLYFKGFIEIRIVITRLNFKNVDKTLEYLLKKYGSFKNLRIVLIHYEIEGAGEENNKKIELSLTRSSKQISAIKDIIINSPVEIRLYHFPLCVVDKELRKYCWITLERKERVYTDKCRKCKLKRQCLGLMKRYYEIYGDNELKPVYK